VRERHDVLAVVTQPDREKRPWQAAGRPAHQDGCAGLTATGSSTRSGSGRRRRERLRALEPQVLVVVAYGQILPREAIALAPAGAVNVHASLLPRYGARRRSSGPSPARARNRRHNDAADEGLDTGPLLLAARTRIDPEETAGVLETRLAQVGAALLIETLARLGHGSSRRCPRTSPWPCTRRGSAKKTAYRLALAAQRSPAECAGSIPGPAPTRYSARASSRSCGRGSAMTPLRPQADPPQRPKRPVGGVRRRPHA